MTDPVLVEVTRGALVESRHRGAIAIVDAAGTPLLALGDIADPVFPRSAVKPLQALALVESGAADAFGFGNVELALACASHNGEPRHVETALRMLAAAGRDETDLECGKQAPSSREAADALVRAGLAPRAVHNNCSGKHSGFICTAAREGVAVKGYVRHDHSVMRQVTAVLAAMTGATLDERVRGVDGCSIPTYAVPLDRLALGFARFVTGLDVSPKRARAARRLFDACAAEPFLVAGTGRFDTDALAAYPGRLIVKVGAEGVHCAGFPERGLGVAIKCDDGSGRAADLLMAEVIGAILGPAGQEATAFARRQAPTRITNWAGTKVGEVRLAEGVAETVRAALR